jgi:repressor of nif and glnA expression
VFKRQELPRLVMSILREAREPLAVRDIARLALAAKGIRYPEPSIMKRTRVRLQQYLGKLDQRGVTRKVGSGNRTRRVLMR